jgi:hypothetical protein
LIDEYFQSGSEKAVQKGNGRRWVHETPRSPLRQTDEARRRERCASGRASEALAASKAGPDGASKEATTSQALSPSSPSPQSPHRQQALELRRTVSL